MVLRIVNHPHTKENVMFENLSISTIPFEPNWNNGTGYFDAAVRHPVTTDCQSSDANGRKIIIIKLTGGKNLVVFERYTNNHDVWVSNTPRGISSIFSSKLSQFEMNLVERMLKGDFSVTKSELEDYLSQFCDPEFAMKDVSRAFEVLGVVIVD
jgi:hypothetical protein